MSNYATHVKNLASDFFVERCHRNADGKKKGDPEAPPHRMDDPLILALMRGEVKWEHVRQAWERARGVDDLSNRALSNIAEREAAQDRVALDNKED